MKKLFLSLLLLLLLPFTFYSFTYAQESEQESSGITVPEDRMILPPFPQNQPFLGQNHNYTVTFRGNGEAVVAMKVALTNTADKEGLKNVELRFPKVDPEEFAVYQIISQGYCIRYETFNPSYTGGNYRAPCLEYSEPDYYGYSYNNKYQKAKIDYQGDTLKVELPTSIAPQKSGAFFVYFRAFGFTDKNSFGTYKFNFETLKVNESINQLTVGVRTDSDQFLKGARGEVDYRLAETTAALKGAPAADTASSSPALDNFISQIGQGQIIKTANNLAASESYKVEGLYADSRLKLYAKETVFFVIFVFSAFVILVLVAKFALKSLTSTQKVKVRKSENIEVKQVGNGGFVAALGLSFASSLIITGYTVGIMFLLSSFSYGYVDYQLASMLRLAIGIFSVFFYSLTLVAPAVYLGYKTSIGWGLTYLFMAVGWLFLFFVTILFVVYLFGYGKNGIFPPVMPLFDRDANVQTVELAKPAQ